MTASERWIEVVVDVPAGSEERVGDVLCHPPITGVELLDGAVRAHAREDLFTTAVREDLAARLLALASESGDASLGVLVARFTPVTFDAALLDGRVVFRSFRVGRIVIGPRSDRTALRPADVALVLLPGGAFGTGRHASTRAALRLLQVALPPGARVLDAGSGSGILAVASLVLGAATALAFDVDPNAAPSAAELARDNGVGDRLAIRTGGFEVLTEIDRDFDVVLANLYADLLRDHAARLIARLRLGGTFIAAGLRAWEAEAIERIAAAAGLTITDRTRRGRWAAFAGRKSEENGAR